MYIFEIYFLRNEGSTIIKKMYMITIFGNIIHFIANIAIVLLLYC